MSFAYKLVKREKRKYLIEKELAHQWWKVAWSELTAANAAGEIEVSDKT